ncbi:hypothetical protein BO71DRAFT_483232 [Aspergillus ellipticus CBS 707.79]|uniref:Hydrophobic surface binding protein A n=1 Tax=Aspergillus ellipticus CBS 707.79 TaxID=1448320 RepID=A0A319E3C8_9EURO|nr:hypothetical protein BO71DRAFT_483232 [Aspergillus ellipticus CBS 707.79]
MKFTGIAASLALAGSVSTAALPAGTDAVGVTLRSTLTELTGVLGRVDSLVDGLLGCVSPSDLGPVKTKLTSIEGQLNQMLPSSSSSKRDLEGTAVDVAAPVKKVAGSAVNTVEGAATGVAADVSAKVDVKRDTEGLNTLSQTIVNKVHSGDLDAPHLEHVLTILNLNGTLANVQAAISLLL